MNFHLGYCPAHTLALNTVCLLNDVPLVLTLHTYCETEFDKMMLRELMWKKVISITKNMAEHAYACGLPIEKLATIYNGISIKKFRSDLKKDWLRNKAKIPRRATVIVCPTRIIKSSTGEPLFERKGLIVLLKALSIVSQIKKNIKLVIVAAKAHPSKKKHQDDALKKLKEFAKVYGVERNLVVIDGIKPKNMPLVYNDADMMVLPAQNEPFGLVYIEAMACGTPVVGCSSGGVPEIIQNGVNGYLTTQDDSVELGKRIIWLLKKKKKIKEFGENGRELIREKFSLNQLTKEIVKVYYEVTK